MTRAAVCHSAAVHGAPCGAAATLATASTGMRGILRPRVSLSSRAVQGNEWDCAICLCVRGHKSAPPKLDSPHSRIRHHRRGSLSRIAVNWLGSEWLFDTNLCSDWT